MRFGFQYEAAPDGRKQAFSNPKVGFFNLGTSVTGMKISEIGGLRKLVLVNLGLLHIKSQTTTVGYLSQYKKREILM